MPDYMYLLESRLSPEQRAALLRVQELARAQDSNLYLTGGAVRDLISGMPLRDLDFTIEGNPSRIGRELEKGGARILHEDERHRHIEIVFAGDADGSISAARDEVYERPGSRPEIRWSTVMEDLRRRDFSINAIAISLNANSRGLLLDPTNGLADLEKHEVRALSIHAFTNQPIRLLRILRYCARMGFKMEARTAEWFDLAMERRLHETLDGAAVGQEVRQLGREDRPVAILKSWESHGLLGAIYPHLARRRPDYENLSRLARVRESLNAAGVRPRLFAPVTYYLLARLKQRERGAALRRMEFRAAEMEAITKLPDEAQKISKILKGRKTNTPRDAYFFLVKVPPELLAFLETEFPSPRALNKIRNYLARWRPLRLSLPVADLDALGIPRGPKFDKILEDLFELQLRGKGRKPEDRTKRLRKLAGIKEEPKKKPKEEKKKAKEKAQAGAEAKAKLKAKLTEPPAEAAKAAPAAAPQAAKPAAKPTAKAPAKAAEKPAEKPAKKVSMPPAAKKRAPEKKRPAPKPKRPKRTKHAKRAHRR